MWHTEKVSVLNELKNLATRWKLEVCDINSTLGIYKIAVYLWNSVNVVGQENYDFFRHPRNNIFSFLILPKTQKCMQKISKQLTTFIDHRQTGESLRKEIQKNIGNKFLKKRVLGLTEIKFRKLVSKYQNTPAQEESFSNILGESNQLSKWNAFVCTRRNPTVPDSGPELDLPFLFIREWNGRFANWPNFWFTFPYHSNFGPILDRFPGFFHTPPLSLPAFWNGPDRTVPV